MLKRLEEIQLPDLINYDFDSFVNEIHSIIRQDPQWNELYGDPTEYPSGVQLITNLFSFVFSKNAEGFNRQLRELFYQHAISEDSLISEIQKRGIVFRQNNAPEVTVTGNLLDNTLLSDEPLYIPRVQLNATNINGQPTVYEIINKLDDGAYDYLGFSTVYPSDIHKDIFNVQAFAGVTKNIIQPITGQHLKNFNIQIKSGNIIEGSVGIYYREKNIYTRLKRVPTLNTPVDSTELPKYFLYYSQNGDAVISFGNKDFGGEFTLDQINNGGQLYIFYREGGGVNAHIAKGAINVNDVILYGASNLPVQYINTNPVYGGVNRESVQNLREQLHSKTNRDGTIIDDIDIANKFYGVVFKYKTDKPTLSPSDNNIPLLHNFHYVVPKRTDNDFINGYFKIDLPDILPDDNIDDFYGRFLDNVNAKLNLDGLRDETQKSTTITISDYEDDWDIINAPQLPERGLMSGTLRINAYNQNDTLVDSLHFLDMYNSYVNATHNKDYLRIESNSFASFSIGTQNKIELKIYLYDTLGNRVDSNPMHIEFDVRGVISSSQLATRINEEAQSWLIREGADSPSHGFNKYIDYMFAYAENTNPLNINIRKVILLSGDIQDDALIEIVDVGASFHDFYDMLGWRIGENYKTNSSAQVFIPGESIYDPASSRVNFRFNLNNMNEDVVKTITMPEQNTNEATGPIVQYELKDKFFKDLFTKFKSNSTLEIQALSDTDMQVDKIIFDSTNDGDTSSSVEEGIIFKPSNGLIISNEEKTAVELHYLDGEEQVDTKTSFKDEDPISKILMRRTFEVLEYVEDESFIEDEDGEPIDIYFQVDDQNKSGHFVGDTAHRSPLDATIESQRPYKISIDFDLPGFPVRVYDAILINNQGYDFGDVRLVGNIQTPPPTTIQTSTQDISDVDLLVHPSSNPTQGKFHDDTLVKMFGEELPLFSNMERLKLNLSGSLWVEVNSITGFGTFDNEVIFSGNIPANDTEGDLSYIIESLEYDLIIPTQGKITKFQIHKNIEKTQEEEFEALSNWNQNPLQIDGPIINLPITMFANNTYEFWIKQKKDTEDYPLHTKFKFETNDPITNPLLRLDEGYANENNIIKEEEPLQYIQSSNGNYVQIYCSDGIPNESTKRFVKGYESFSKLRFVYKRDLYSRLEAEYYLNVYETEGEVNNLLQILRTPSSRLLCLEHLFRKVDFLPLGFHIQIRVNRNHSLGIAKKYVEDVLYNYLKYNNTTTHDIGSEVNADSLKNYILNNIPPCGIEELNILNSLSFYDQYINRSDFTYRFVLPGAYMSYIESVKNNYDKDTRQYELMEEFYNKIFIKVEANY